jgi:hypothetical protein
MKFLERGQAGGGLGNPVLRRTFFHGSPDFFPASLNSLSACVKITLMREITSKWEQFFEAKSCRGKYFLRSCAKKTAP